MKVNTPRDVFQEQIRANLLGPGSDIFVQTEHQEIEIIDDYPLRRYFTGVLFPDKYMLGSQSELDDAEVETETSDEGEDLQALEEENVKEELEDKKDIIEDSTKRIKDKSIEEQAHYSNFFPRTMGLTFCVDKNQKTIEVEFSAGIYKQIDETTAKIKISEVGFNAFTNEKSTFPFKAQLKHENGYMFLTTKLKGKRGGKGKPRDGDFKEFDDFKKSDGLKEQPSLKAHLHFFEKLIGRVWQREPIREKVSIEVKSTSNIQTIFERKIGKKHTVELGYSVKVYGINDRNYVRIQLLNSSSDHSPKKFSNKNELLNKKCFFQTQIKVVNTPFQTYKSYQEVHPYDVEGERLNYLYKDVSDFGIGHNCAVQWENKGFPTWVSTSFLPYYDLKDTKNNFNENDFEKSEDYQLLNECLDIYDLSIFSEVSQDKTIEKLNSFVSLYGQWIENQKNSIGEANKIETHFLSKLDANLKRLQRNIGYLKNKEAFKAFQLANAAMLIQLIISNDSDFSGKEKDWVELTDSISYGDIAFFKNYDFNRLPFKRPRYRPFQLAFLLLNLDGIIDLESVSRNKIVDLLWFPTGGGKTEAYLAVAAFTIIWRRMKNLQDYGGTTVIMRYTLRLLTAQQFERASRLIVSLEFLRHYFTEELKEERISIGLWVGQASTPNTLKGDKSADEALKKITEECDKGDSGNPTQKNVFQISACPWCGTKLITKNQYDNWAKGFELYNRNRNFRIKCLNERCHFHPELPIQVVDEVLYKQPPTLLFATVDKFAVLSWQEKGHHFFNSQGAEGLPPDLIIQDELHLLSGPLGSITGIYESVIEILCTKNNRRPKIIASTATTRNTSEQIKGLYGTMREVNVFPPSGLSFKDSFFAKQAVEKSKRRYMGFIPTGKSAIDAQLQLIANLLVSRLEVYLRYREEVDKYWTLVSYYNSLKGVGKIYNKVGDEISSSTSSLQNRLWADNPDFKFNYIGLPSRVVELTSRIDSAKIKQTLKDLEEKTFSKDKIEKYPKTGVTYIKDVLDLILATNMISVGIDVARLNVMLINSQPKNIAEYIQASSRVGRTYKGLVVVLFDANKARDKSHFEHFVNFHQAFYKSVEPISITPFTENTIDKMLTSIMVTYVRNKVAGMSKNDSAQYFEKGMLKGLKIELQKRYAKDDIAYQTFEEKLSDLAEDWEGKIEIGVQHYKGNSHKVGLLKYPSEQEEENRQWITMQSMREIDTSSFIQIDFSNLNNRRRK